MSFDAPAPVSGSSKKNFQTILAGRKCYRMSKDKNEVVWPPHLEAALMEGLEKYAPAESKSPRGLTRFPNRNKFIAEHILKTTGEIRTAKQVGSRIQQLRDTSAGKTIMKAISDRHYEMMHPTRPRESAQDMTFADVHFGAGTMLQASNSVLHVYLSVSSWTAATAAYGQATRQSPVSVLSGSAYEWSEPRALRTIDPTVTFKSLSPLPLFSSYTVYCNGTIVHMDQAELMGMQDSAKGYYLHYTTLTPGYWDSLCGSTDLSPYTIWQEITKQGTDPTAKPVTVMVIQYHFNTTSAPPLSPFNVHEEDLEVDYETDEMLPAMTGHALSTCSDSPYPSDRSDSPSYTVPGFCSQPLSPVDWPPSSWASYPPAQGSMSSGQSSQLSASGYYAMPQQQHQQQQQQPQSQSQSSRAYLGHSQF